MKKSIHLLLLIFSPALFASEVKVAAASDLKFALDQVIERYVVQHPKEKVVAVYGASGKFVSQIAAGAPFDIFFSADTEKAAELVKTGKTSGQPFQYAHGHLVLWVRNGSKIQLDGKMECLKNTNVKKIAVANAQIAPYGKVAEQALKNANVYEQVRSKLVVGENISQTAQFVESNAADVGLIAKSLALSPTLKREGHFVDVDVSLYEALAQSGVLLNTANLKAAQNFMDYFLSVEGQQLLNSYGLTR